MWSFVDTGNEATTQRIIMMMFTNTGLLFRID